MAYYNWENKEQLIEDLKKSASISNFLDNQGLVASSGNYDTFKKWMKKHEIDAKDYLTNQINYSPINRNLGKVLDYLTAEEVLCINSKYDRKEANKVIRRENLLPYICSSCSNKGTWNNKPLTLQLEHKNGNSSDHRLENLEYLCPNCHSQTNTYGSKNKHNNIFEERIRDISECEVKEITNIELELLAEKWDRSINTVYSWINKYSEKIQEAGYLLNLTPLDRKSSEIVLEKNNEILNSRIMDIKESQKSTDFEEKLSMKWNITRKEVRKWLKINAKDFYFLKYVTSTRYNVSNYQDKLYKEIHEIIIKDSQNNNYDYNQMLSLFNMNVGSCSFYLKNKFPDHHKKYFISKPCPHCNGEKVNKNGMRSVGGVNKQIYKCRDCKINFY